MIFLLAIRFILILVRIVVTLCSMSSSLVIILLGFSILVGLQTLLDSSLSFGDVLDFIVVV